MYTQALSENSEADYTKNDTKDREITPYNDPELSAVIDAWPTMPDAIRVAITALIRMSNPPDRMDRTDTIPTSVEREAPAR